MFSMGSLSKLPTTCRLCLLTLLYQIDLLGVNARAIISTSASRNPPQLIMPQSTIPKVENHNNVDIPGSNVDGVGGIPSSGSTRGLRRRRGRENRKLIKVSAKRGGGKSKGGKGGEAKATEITDTSEEDIADTLMSMSPSGPSHDIDFPNTNAPVLPHSDDGRDALRTVQLAHPDNTDECMAYIEGLSEQAVQLVQCSTPSSDSSVVPIDHWEVMEVEDGLFNLRHKTSQLCIPMNPESPDQSFDCFRYSGHEVAIADSINGLVDCATGFAATMGMDLETSIMVLYNTDCLEEVEPGHEADVLLMSYGTDGVNGTQIVVWGEKIILDMPDITAQHNFQSEWMLSDV